MKLKQHILKTRSAKAYLTSVCLLPLCGLSATALADDLDKIERLEVRGRQINTLGHSTSASEGIVGAAEIESRPLLRTGEILEFVPGMIVTQHSGSGKANQYFLRGFNLDHGTDFNTRVEGMPVNMRTHGHGQGYTDLNFLIPELLGEIRYAKGAYYPEVADFSGAGAAQILLADELAYRQVGVTLGEYGYQRLVATQDMKTDAGRFILGTELQAYDGPWSDIKEDVSKVNVVGRYLTKLNGGDFSLTMMAYDNSWNSADQIPARAVESGLIDFYGSLDTDVGGEASRYSISANYDAGNWQANAYAIRSTMDLFSNFTYFLNDPINGDEFEQVDERTIWGGDIKRDWQMSLAGTQINYSLGADVRYDDIGAVGLYNTKARERLSTVRLDEVQELSTGLFGKLEWLPADQWRLNLGLRYDYFDVQVDSDNPLNSGDASDGMLSLKAGASYLVNDNLELYMNAGQGLHSNDARGATIKVDPVTGDPVEKVDLLVRSNGGEFGVKYYDRDFINFSAALWYLELDSELLFVGDAGNTEPSRASERYGVEVTAYYWLNDDLSLDMELAWTRARFTENELDEGKYVDGAVPFVGSAGITYRPDGDGWYTSVRLRYLGERILDSFNEHKADDTTLVNLALGYQLSGFDTKLELLNIFDSKDHDIDYFYESRLAGEQAEGVEDLHYHPVEPRMVRVSVSYRF
ncbi:TonB-dependent receptor [Shewanella xiamenensis]|uniref:TonB-dependent receptor n=1 Tax=Shewanella xiamenensis TaxID=332186 RepID=UPI00244D2092|nr:TonB-dependent receptor [Shewanella xiamenensis]MDH1316536.1 TonB-dependent receptor [Shewanella xiamenensis]